MTRGIAVSTAFAPGTPRPEEQGVFQTAPDIEFQLRGPCHTEAELIAAVQDADVALCVHEFFTDTVFAAAPRLKAVVRCGSGVDTVDLDAATKHGVLVPYFPDFCVQEVANHALVHLLCCAKRIPWFDRTLRSEGWSAVGKVRASRPMRPIHGETLGLMTLGRTARAVAERGHVLHMKVIAWAPHSGPEVFEEANVESVSIEELAARSDYVSCHLPLSPSTVGFVDASFFARMKPTAYFINTSRGPIVVQDHLVAALQEGRIAGAGLDVFDPEPLPSDSPLLGMDNVVLSPHTASSADETFAKMWRRSAQAAIDVIHGRVPRIIANPAVLTWPRYASDSLTSNSVPSA